jgi:transcriptional regulator with XRE-family HTH domain
MAQKTGKVGQALRSMREQRQMTQNEVARVSGLSPSGVGSIEAGRREPRESSVHLFVTALATRRPLNPVEIQRLANLTGREPSFFEDANERTGSRSAAPEPPRGIRSRVELAGRLQRALDTLLSSGAEVEAIELLESIARWSSTARVVADPRDDPPGEQTSEHERQALRTIRVVYPEQPGPVPGSVSQDYRQYDVHEDAEHRDTEHREGGNANAS